MSNNTNGIDKTSAGGTRQLRLFKSASVIRQLRLFSIGNFERLDVDPLAGWALMDVRALAIDPDPMVRLVAARSWWCVDVRLQRVLAVDPDERVVSAFLSNVDPGVEACELIISGSHVGARLDLASRRLRPELLARLAQDPDRSVAAAAESGLRRSGSLRASVVES